MVQLPCYFHPHCSYKTERLKYKHANEQLHWHMKFVHNATNTAVDTKISNDSKVNNSENQEKIGPIIEDLSQVNKCLELSEEDAALASSAVNNCEESDQNQAFSEEKSNPVNQGM